MSFSQMMHLLKMTIYLLVGLLLLFLAVQGVRCALALKDADRRLQAYGAKTAALSYGEMTYVDQGTGDALLSIHGIFGGYDQAFDTCKEIADTYRIIAPSRFGYLGSEVWGEGTPALQAAAYLELLDKLEIDKVYLLATSAGGTVAIRFALDYPERTKGLILYSSAAPPTQKPSEVVAYQGPPPFLCNSYGMFAVSPLFRPIMGMEPSMIYSMLPVEGRKRGIEIDASITNPDMERNFEQYPIEELKVPTLIFHAKDDKLASYDRTEDAVSRFPDCTFLSFETGGHLMKGHAEEINRALFAFTAAQ